ncbi:MAG: hypothetical protein AAFZ15_33540, partial [Bacteroidota bacterium]
MKKSFTCLIYSNFLFKGFDGCKSYRIPFLLALLMVILGPSPTWAQVVKPEFGSSVQTNQHNVVDNSVIGVNDDQFVVTYTQLSAGGSGQAHYARVGTITGTNTITLGTEVQVSPRPNRYLRIQKLSEDVCVICYNFDDPGGSTNDRMKCIVGTVSGTGSTATITFGTEQSTGVRGQTAVYPAIARLTDTKFAIAFEHDNGTSDKGVMYIGEVSGTGAGASISFGFQFAFTTPGQDVKGVGLDALSSTVLALTYEDDDNGDVGQTIIATVSGTDITYNTKSQFNGINSVHQTNVAAISSNQYIILWGQDSSATAGDDMYGRVVDVTGSGATATVSYGLKTLVHDSTTAVNATDNRITKIGPNDFIAAFHRSTNDASVVRVQVTGNTIDFSGRQDFFSSTPDFIDVGVVREGVFVCAIQDETTIGDPGLVFVGTANVGASFTCPTIGSVSVAPDPVCPGEMFTATATGLSDLAMADNNDQDYNIEFKALTGSETDPYSEGISLGTVTFGSLTMGGTEAELSNATIASPGNYDIYAILTPAPSDISCRPESQTSLTVNTAPSCTATNSGPVCPGDDVTLNETGGDATGWAWSSNGSATFDDASAQGPTASGAVNGEIFTVVVTDGNGCTS